MIVIAWGSLSAEVGVRAGPDLLIHALAYLVLAWLIRRASQWPRGRAWLLAGAFAWGFGLIMEAMQVTLVSRSGEVRDVIANALGAAVGGALPSWHCAAPRRS